MGLCVHDSKAWTPVHVCDQACLFVCATELEESTLISVSLESVIEHEPFRQRVEAVTLCNNTRGDKKKGEVLFCPIFSLRSVFILAFLCFYSFLFPLL